MRYLSVDVEADGPSPANHSMIAIGAVFVDDPMATFSATLRPISNQWVPEALAVSGFTREQTLLFRDPFEVMTEFDAWVRDNSGQGDRVTLLSDNAVFDGMWITVYLHKFLGKSVLGWSGISLTSLYKGYAKDMRANFKHLRKTKHDHDPLNDARGNAEAMRTILEGMNRA